MPVQSRLCGLGILSCDAIAIKADNKGVPVGHKGGQGSTTLPKRFISSEKRCPIKRRPLSREFTTSCQFLESFRPLPFTLSCDATKQPRSSSPLAIEVAQLATETGQCSDRRPSRAYCHSPPLSVCIGLAIGSGKNFGSFAENQC